MRFDWQTVAVVLIILAALVYTARRGLGRLRSFRTAGAGGAASCETNCGSCGGESQAAAKRTPVLVQINSSATVSRRAGR